MMPVARLLLSSLLLIVLGTLSHAAEPRKIGTAIEITNQVTATEEDKAKRRLAKRDPVRELEVLETARNANGEFILADDTKLALGPNARLALDKFVYDPDKTTGGKVTVNFANRQRCVSVYYWKQQQRGLRNQDAHRVARRARDSL